ncbi:MAG: metal-sensing transcriptional repressor [Candidatus Aminicenantes bacterium]|nr:metal-sensing transcriptional repressor [Candidatus Aminicenantes bacterium]
MVTNTYEEDIVRLKRIEGQIIGIQKMILDKRYCIEFLTQLSSIVATIKSVEENIMYRHFRGCIQESFKNGSKEDRAEKLDEIKRLFRKFRK